MSATTKRDTARNAIKRSLNHSKKTESLDTAELDSCIFILKEQWIKFDLAQEAVEDTCSEKTLSAQEVERDQGEQWYREALTNFNRASKLLKTSTPSPVKEDKLSRAVRADVYLPPMRLPTFDGNPKEWKPFEDQFSSFVHSESSLSSAQKLHFLLTSLQGPALQVVKGFRITNNNYEEVWELLKKRYDAERIIVDSHFQALFALKKIENESSTAIKALVDVIQEHFRSLKALGRPVTNWDDWLVHLTISKLDIETHKQWELSQSDNKIADFNTLINFLETRCRSLDAISSHQVMAKPQPGRTKQKPSNSFHIGSTEKRQGYQKTMCLYCSGKHLIYICEKFRALEVPKRVSFAQSNNLCVNCMGTGHSLKDCPSTNTCRICHLRHHTMLHSGQQISNAPSQLTTSSPNFTPSYASHSKHHVLLGTALVQVMDKSQRYQPARLLFDNGSHASFVSETCVQRLQLKRTPSTTAIEGIGATAAGTSKGQVRLTLSSADGTFTTTITAQILNKITSNLPPVQIKEFNWPHIQGLKLADPYFNTPASIDVLLGSDELGQFLYAGLIKGPIGTPFAQNSTLGWVLQGKIDDSTPTTSSLSSICLHSDTALTKAVSKFWEVESLPDVKHLTIEEKLCEQFFEDTHYRQKDGRYVVQLPFKPECPLGNSRSAAVRALFRMEKVFSKDEYIFQQYKDFIHEFIQLGHMEQVHQPPKPGEHYYMPHRFVIKNTSTTTKLRVVFNASCRTNSGYSLNDSQMIGPQLQPDLFTTLLRFRTHRFAMCADIAKMYRQVLVDRNHIDYQRIVWRDSPSEDIKDYRLLTVTYGVASASHLAVKSLQQAAKDEYNSLSAEVILRDFYMDDLLTGCFEEADLQHLQVEITTILSRSGFHLRKWSSNSSILMDSIPEDQREIIQSLDLCDSNSVRTLGFQWDPSSDHLLFPVQVHEIDKTKLTKRLLLSDTTKLFDPLGLLSPCTIIPKILFQSLWRPKVDWDEIVPQDLKQKWLNYRDHITCLAEIKVPRWVGTGIPNAVTDLHGFADASQSAYAAVVYARSISPDGNISVCFIAAKTRVAPLKSNTLSLPRLELCGALLLSQLIGHVKTVMKANIRNIYGWTDSTVALAWIRQQPGKWCTFVANRVSEIQQVIPSEHWFHVPSSDNPADCATRGVLPQHLANHRLWWSGPTWLQKEKPLWPLQQIFATNLDQRAESTSLLSNSEAPVIWDIIDRYSNIKKLMRITAYILRYIRKIRRAVKMRKNEFVDPLQYQPNLQPEELEEALTIWIRITQRHFFADDLKRLLSKKPINRFSKLIKLNIFLDDNGLIRVGGRLSKSTLQQNQKHPLVLHSLSKLALLICEDIHYRTTLHAGPQAMLVTLQSRFWIIGARKVLRKVYTKCVKCRRHTTIIQQQLMGDLPRPRVEACRPFLRAGVDFAGPVSLRFSKGRGSKSVKGYISIFICMSTGAMHLELASDLSSSTFIAVFKRFVSRRGHCKELFSDNGTNFVGADKELKILLDQAVKDEHLAKYLADDGTIWHFNPPAAPHMGGYWEAAVKRVKFHLRRILGDNLLTFEEFYTVLTEIEACVNSRPLCPTSSDIDNYEALTPGHYLIGEPLKIIPEPTSYNFRGSLLNRWRLISSLRQQFWKRWSDEYLVHLQQRSKWNRQTSNFNVGDLIVLRDEKLPPTKWRLGRIINIHPGSDGKVRVVSIKTAAGELMRPIVKIAPLLPITEDL